MTNYKKIAEEDPAFAAYMVKAATELLLRSHEFDPLISLLYSFYHTDVPVQKAVATTLMMINLNKADD